jgi:hypothetical protein
MNPIVNLGGAVRRAEWAPSGIARTRFARVKPNVPLDSRRCTANNRLSTASMRIVGTRRSGGVCRRLRLGVVALGLCSRVRRGVRAAMTGRVTHRSSTTQQRAGSARAAWRDAASLSANIGEMRALGDERTFAQRDGGVWNTFGTGFRVTGGASPFGTISDAVFTIAREQRIARPPIGRREDCHTGIAR